MSAAWHRGIRKALRTVVQLAAGGALTALVSALSDGLAPSTQGVVMAAWTVLVTLAQNTAETAGKIPTLLPTPGVVPSRAAVTTAVGTVATTVEDADDATAVVVGTVEDLEGQILGEVSGVFDDETTGS